MTDDRLSTASSDLVTSMRELNQTVAKTLVTIVDRNLTFAQSLFLSGIEVLEAQTQDLPQLRQVWGQQTQQQQEAFQQLASGMMETFLNILRPWLAFSEQREGAPHSAVDREPQLAQAGAQREREDRPYVCFARIRFQRRHRKLPLFEHGWQSLKLALRQNSLPRVQFAIQPLPKDFFRFFRTRPAVSACQIGSCSRLYVATWQGYLAMNSCHQFRVA